MKFMTLIVLAVPLLWGCDDISKTKEKFEKGVEVARETAETLEKKAKTAKEKAGGLEGTTEKVKEAASKVKEKAQKAEDAAANFVLPAEKAEKLGDRMAKEIFAKQERVEGPMADYVRELAAGLVEAAEGRSEGIEYDFWVIRDDAVNAFAIPGGHIFLTTGILADFENEAELVAVLGHEIAHVIERHAAERLVASYGISAITALALGRDAEELEKIVAKIIGEGVLLKNSRDDERQADEVGMELAIEAGHSPQGFVTFFRRLAESNNVPALLSTHPNPGDRAEAAASKIDNLEAEIRGRSLHRSRYREIVEANL